MTMFRVKLRKIIPYINKQVLREKNGYVSLYFFNNIVIVTKTTNSF